jgi:hypothetical protein
MLALSAGILRANLLAIDALHGETLFLVRTGFIRSRFHWVHQAKRAYLVFLFRAELDKCSVHII